MLLFFGLIAQAQAQETNFSRDVATSIDRGLLWLDQQGAFNNPSSAGDAAGLVALTLLEKRASADQNAQPSGYLNASPADQARIERVMTYIINRAAGNNFYAYRDGGDLMALSVYLRSGGPSQAGALNSIRSVFDRMAANQNDSGYWCYNNGGCNDSSTTQLTMAGLAAARGVFNEPAYPDPARLARLNQLAAASGAGYLANGMADGLDAIERGHGYNAGDAPSYQQTASGLWGQIIGGADLNDVGVQAYLRWLRNRYNFQTTSAAAGGWSLSYYYYLWASAKSFTFLEDSGVLPAAGNLSVADVGTLPANAAPAFGARLTHYDPATVARAPSMGGEGPGYYASPFEPVRWYFDYAFWLVSKQQAGGFFPDFLGNSRWGDFDSQSYALLVLERSVGGGCVDTDDDEICDFEDNCPNQGNNLQADLDGDRVGDLCDNCILIGNPDQADPEGDRVGSLCDNCPALPNPDQVDIDHDNIGDACDSVICIPVGLEVCNGLDDDCDGQADDGDPGGRADCDTGELGVCAAGTTQCRAGIIVCDGLRSPVADVCNGRDDDCDGAVDQGDPGGDVVCATGLLGACASGVLHCLDGGLSCVPNASPRAELCDGTDDDCDGGVDEDMPEGGAGCDTGQEGLCVAGLTTCLDGRLLCLRSIEPAAERCDGSDNDCDGDIDEGDPAGGVACISGRPGVCAAGLTHCVDAVVVCVSDFVGGAELCNGLDDDCDGSVDQGDPEGGQPRDTGRRGICADGRNACAQGGLICNPIGEGSDELCDGLDNDCDGSTDEGLGIGQDCDSGLPGVCVPGRRVCDGGLILCAPLVPPSAEVCDGLDNDCDGLVDDAVAGTGELCGTGERGVCARGHRACNLGLLVCVGDEMAVNERCNLQDDDCDGVIDDGLRNACGQCGDLPVERCDGEDNDCDGVTDDDAPCPLGQACAHGACLQTCGNNECPGEWLCVAGICVTPCDLVECTEDQRCEEGACVDLCLGVDCAAGEVCDRGLCVADSCYETGCEDGEACVDFVCQADACAEIFCNDGEFCRGGACVRSCAEVSCAFAEHCIDGVCVMNACVEVELSCAGDQVCEDGVCQADPCEGITCDAGRRCVDGICQHDGCEGVECPAAEKCVIIDGEAQCTADWAPVDNPTIRPNEGPDMGTPLENMDLGLGDFGLPETPPTEAPPTSSGDAGLTEDAPDQITSCACRVNRSGGGAMAMLGALALLLMRPRRTRL